MSSVSTIVRRTIRSFRIRRGKDNKSVIRQIWENLVLILRIQLEPREYYLFRLYPRKVKKDRAVDYLNSAQFMREINPVLNPAQWHFILNDKLFANLYFRNHGLPVARQYGFYSKDCGYVEGGGKLTGRQDFHDFLRQEKPENLVLKPHDAFGGYGVMVFHKIHYRQDLRFESPAGGTATLGELTERIDAALKTDPGIRGYLLESMVDQHPLLQEIYPHSVNTLRILTYLTKQGEPRIIGTRLRMGRKGNPVDNISQGGIHASVDRETGTITSGFTLSSGKEMKLEKHPDTGIGFQGIQIPGWQDVLDLARKAARATPLQRFVGWDIALGKAGPVLIEGNSHGVEVAYDQLHGRAFLTDEFRRDMLAYGIRLPDKLPGIHPGKIFQSYKISRSMHKIG